MALTDTYGTYEKEMERACNDGKKAAEHFQKNLPKMMNEVQPWMKEMMKAVADMSKVSAPQRLVIEVFAWSGVLVLACSVGSLLGAYVLSSVFAAMISKFTASILAYFVIPIAIHASIKHKERQFQSDNNIRRMMIASTFGQGLLMGYTINQRYLSSQPLAFITPIAVSFGYATRGHAFQNLHNAFYALFKGMTFYCFGTYIE
ncbi:hypothetical protein OSTOST_11605 [Ostertagia ostertagi]